MFLHNLVNQNFRDPRIPVESTAEGAVRRYKLSKTFSPSSSNSDMYPGKEHII